MATISPHPSLERHSPIEVRHYGQKGQHLPAFGLRIIVEHEGIEVVCNVTDAQIDCMLGTFCAERALVTQIQSEDRGHVEVVDTFVILCFRFQAGDVDLIGQRRAILPVAALQGHGQADTLPAAQNV